MLKVKSVPMEYRRLQRLDVANLRIMCEEKKLSLNERKDELTERLWKDCGSRGGLSHSNTHGITPFKPESLSITKCDAVITASVQIASNESMVEKVRKMLADVLEHEGVYVERDAEILTVGNQGRVRLASLAGKAEAA